MCEFKILDLEKKTQLAEEIVVLSYSKQQNLQLMDILGISKELESALIYDVNTLDQTCKVLQHPIINPFIEIIENLNNRTLNETHINDFILKLESLKNELKND